MIAVRRFARRIVSDPAFPAAEGKMIPQVPRRRFTLAATWHAGDRTAFTLAGRYSSRSFGTIDNSDIVAHTYQGFEGFVVLDARSVRVLDRRRAVRPGRLVRASPVARGRAVAALETAAAA